ncbi:MAG: hypothetical protein Kow0059_18140 [Candidatus Sumerlaeia bacterium]
MKISSLIPDDQILLDLAATSYPQAIEKLLETMQGKLPEAVFLAASEFLIRRESEHPTIIYPGVAVPHARIENAGDPMIAFGVSAAGIPSPGDGGDPLRFIVLILAPPSKNTFMLQMMSAVSRLLAAEERRKAILQIKTPQRLVQYLKESEISVKKTLTVEDVMFTQFPALKPDDPLERAVEVMAASTFRAVPVVGEDGRLLGEITLGHLIRLALPDYLGIISNQNFLESFDPFENYFLKERKRPAHEVMRLDCQRVKPETPILEVGQLLIDSGGRQIYVCRGRILIGTIDAANFIQQCLLL